MQKNGFSRVSFLAAVLGTGAMLSACSDSARVTEPAANSAVAGPSIEQPSAATVATATSATITYEVRVPGYSGSGNNGWITISSGCGGGGRVVRAGRADACTDRVSRGEQLRVTIGARNASRMRLTAFAGVGSSNGFFRGAVLPVPTSAVFTVAGDPTFDNVHVAAVLLDSSFRVVGTGIERRVPIGTRP